MSSLQEVKVPDIGDFDEVDVVEVLVAEGDRVEVEDSLITLESDKASMEVPSTVAGVIRELKVKVGDKVGEGAVIVVVETDGGEASPAEPDGETAAGEQQAEEESPQEAEPAADEEAPAAKEVEADRRSAPQTSGAPEDYDCDVLVLGSGPGGYTAAFRAADLDQRTVLVERYPSLGGVCLNVGCIPSKALLHAARVIDEAAGFAEHGITFGAPKIDLDALRSWKQSVVDRLTGGLQQLAKRRHVEVVQGTGCFVGPHELEVRGPEEEARRITFAKAIVAAGSRSVMLPDIPDADDRIMDSTSALELQEVPERLLVVGGGIIGLEMATVYAALGSKVVVVELLDRLMMGADRDLVRHLQKRIARRYEAIFLGTRVTGVEADDEGLEVSFEGPEAPDKERFDRLLVAVGRRPNGDRVGAETAGIEVTERGFIPVDEQMRTNVDHIFAIGDVTGEPMLAHKATHEGKVAAEVAAGEESGFEARVIPSVAYTDPEVAWVGVTEEQAKERGLEVGKGTFPWSASGRNLGLGREDGLTKLLFDAESGRLIGAGVVGSNAGDLIAECGLAIEMGTDAADIGLTIHPHPTLSETVAFAAEAFEGTITDLYLPKKKRS